MSSLFKDLILQSAKQLKTDILVTKQITLLKFQYDERENKFQSIIEENLVMILFITERKSPQKSI